MYNDLIFFIICSRNPWYAPEMSGCTQCRIHPLFRWLGLGLGSRKRVGETETTFWLGSSSWVRGHVVPRWRTHSSLATSNPNSQNFKRSTSDNSGTQGRRKKFFTWLRSIRRDLRGDVFAILVRHWEVWESCRRKGIRALSPNSILKAQLRKPNLRTARLWVTGPISVRSSRRTERVEIWHAQIRLLGEEL